MGEDEPLRSKMEKQRQQVCVYMSMYIYINVCAKEGYKNQLAAVGKGKGPEVSPEQSPTTATRSAHDQTGKRVANRACDYILGMCL